MLLLLLSLPLSSSCSPSCCKHGSVTVTAAVVGVPDDEIEAFESHLGAQQSANVVPAVSVQPVTPVDIIGGHCIGQQSTWPICTQYIIYYYNKTTVSYDYGSKIIIYLPNIRTFDTGISIVDHFGTSRSPILDGHTTLVHYNERNNSTVRDRCLRNHIRFVHNANVHSCTCN